METLEKQVEVSFKGDKDKVKFFKSQTSDLRRANKMMETDFAGTGYDPNFDAGVDGFANYLEEFTNSKWNDFNDAQVETIKHIFCL